ncbi:MAG: transcriptional regulator [Bacteroidetes bacterium]|nr:MAG: transcriptional regulator [Bacteroidota bacterium]
MALTKQEIDFLKKIGRNIKAIRAEKGVSQTELADLCGYERSTLNRLEAGGSNVTAKTLLKIAKALGVTVVDLVQ